MNSELRNFEKICKLTGLDKADLKSILQRYKKEKKSKDSISILNNGLKLQILDSSEKSYRVILWRGTKMLIKTVITIPKPRIMKKRRGGMSEIVGVVVVVFVVSVAGGIFYLQANENAQQAKIIIPANINIFIEDRFPTSAPPNEKVWVDLTMTGPSDTIYITGDIKLCIVPAEESGGSIPDWCDNRPNDWGDTNRGETHPDIKITASGNALLFKYSGILNSSIPIQADQSLIFTIHYGLDETIAKQVRVSGT